MSRQKNPHTLTDYFPWLTEELAEIVTKKLTHQEIRQLIKELKEALDTANRHLFEFLLKQKKTEMIAWIKAQINTPSESTRAESQE